MGNDLAILVGNDRVIPQRRIKDQTVISKELYYASDSLLKDDSLLFASMGVLSGMLSKSHEDIGTYSNFFILPMAFFGGTFFPVENVPGFLKGVIYVLPLTHTNILMRKTSFDSGALISIIVLAVYSTALLVYGTRTIRRYSE